MSGTRILVIESEPWLGEHFEKTLTRDGFKVAVTSNAYSAMDNIDEFHPDVIIMGLLLSGAGGLSLLHELQSYADTAKVPVIVCGTTVSDLSLDELRPYGVRKLLDASTMRPEDMTAAVRSVLS